MASAADPRIDPKWLFLQDVFLSNTIRDSFSVRGGQGIYVAGATDEQRLAVRTCVREELLRLVPMYSRAVPEEEHVQNISELAIRVSSRCNAFLSGGRFRFGIAQKAFNSFLKYFWCVDRIPTPPHCPFDAIILRMLRLPTGCLDQWTRVDDVMTYGAWVLAAKAVAGTQTLADWELKAWQEAGV